ncbi:MAG: hypothetical protein Q8P29_01470 [Candidatus Levybacteria bacterium]|nr:hypothetical protein [Candidatus Levybacteria bacterium]
MKISALRSLIISHFSFLILILLSTFYFLSSASPTYAASQTAAEIQSGTKVASANTNPDVPNNLHNWTQNVMIEVMLSLTCQLVGVDPTTPNKQCLGADQKTGKLGFLPAGNLATGQIGGAIGGMNNMISMLYTPPVRTSDYFQNLAQNFGITKKIYAQQTGTGFDGLRPLLSLWTAFRNIVYLVFVIVFVVIGLAIMLRIKIDPRTVMTIQNQIPKIIIGILLVTFSFAIAGFLIDMMWVLIYLIFGLISGISTDVANSVRDLNPTLLQAKNPFEAISNWDISSMAGNVASKSLSTMQSILGISPSWRDTSILGGILDTGNLLAHFFPIGEHLPTDGSSPFNFLVNVISGASAIFGAFKVITFPPLQASGEFLTFGFGTNAVGLALNWAAGLAAGALIYPMVQEFLRIGVPFLIIYVIIFIALLTALFKLWFALLMAYIKILIDVVLAPFWIMGSLIPGSPISASGWLRDLTANLLAFPAVIFMLLLGKVFMDGFAMATNPFIPPLIGDLGPSMFSSLIGIGMILMTPNVINMLKEMLKAPKMDSGVGKSIAGATGVVTGAGKSTTGAAGLAVFGDPYTGKKGFEAIRSSFLRKA